MRFLWRIVKQQTQTASTNSGRLHNLRKQVSKGVSEEKRKSGTTI